MEIFLTVLVVIGVLLFFAASNRSAKKSSSTRSSAKAGKQHVLDLNGPWLRERWQMADAEKAAGKLQQFPKWYFDEPTDRQRKRLVEDGVTIFRGATKGQHSDAIGLFEKPDSEDLERLKFHGINLKGPLLNQTRARHEISKIYADPEKQRAWLTRPASALQKEFYRFIGEKPPAGLTHEQAEAKKKSAMENFPESQQDEWTTFENLIEEFDDQEFRSDAEIRKPSPLDIRSAMAALKAEGAAFDDPFDVAEKLLEMNPALARKQ